MQNKRHAFNLPGYLVNLIQSTPTLPERQTSFFAVEKVVNNKLWERIAWEGVVRAQDPTVLQRSRRSLLVSAITYKGKHEIITRFPCNCCSVHNKLKTNFVPEVGLSAILGQDSTKRSRFRRSMVSARTFGHFVQWFLQWHNQL